MVNDVFVNILTNIRGLMSEILEMQGYTRMLIPSRVSVGFGSLVSCPCMFDCVVF